MVKIDNSFVTAASVVFDAIYVPGGEESISTLIEEGDAIHFLDEAYRHCKPIGTDGGLKLLQETHFWNKVTANELSEKGVIVDK